MSGDLLLVMVCKQCYNIPCAKILIASRRRSHPVAFLMFPQRTFFYGMGFVTPRPNPNLGDQGVHFCLGHHLWPVPTSICAIVGLTLGVIWPHKHHKYVKTETISGMGCRGGGSLSFNFSLLTLFFQKEVRVNHSKSLFLIVTEKARYFYIDISAILYVFTPFILV